MNNASQRTKMSHFTLGV